MDQRRLANALGYAANIATGIIEGWRVTHFYSLMARNGTLCAQLAKAGGAPTSDLTLEGPLGLSRSFYGEVPRELQASLDALGSDWEMLKAIQKRYQGTGSNIIAIELLTAIVRENAIAADDVSRIDVILSSRREARTEVMLAGPFATRTKALGSLPMALALVLLDGEVRPERYAADRVNDPNVLRIAGRCTVSFEDGHDVARYCRIEVRHVDGRRFVRSDDRFMFGFPQSDWRAWLERDGTRVLRSDNLRRLEELIASLEDVDDKAELAECLAPVPG